MRRIASRLIIGICWVVAACNDDGTAQPSCAGAVLGEPCAVGVGACANEGTWACGDDGRVVCSAAPGAPTAERCNGLDDDCDGAIDNGLGLGEDCVAGIGACTVHGHFACDAAGQVQCDATPSEPSSERCNGLDDDCDGVPDNGLGLGGSCEVGIGACRRDGVVICDGASDAARCSADPGAPGSETCNGIDDDCNSVIDDVAGVGDECVADAQGICARGRKTCSGDRLVCAPGAPEVETCNGLDDDCNGVVDDDPEVGALCTTGGLGVCSAGTKACGPGGLICRQTTAAGPEVCNGLDDDCDGGVDDACVPQVPRARSPWNGMLTGSLWTPERPGAPAPLRPRFIWTAVPGADRYELEVDDSCAPGAFRSCAFPSPEISATVTATVFQPAQPLAVDATAPVGRRYYWRMRACGPGGCSAYSEVRYLDVGRVPGDVNGDGYPDLVVGGNRDQGTGRVFLYLSGPSGLATTPAGSLGPPQPTSLFRHGTIVGDLDGDGFADVVVADTGFANFTGVVHVYRGSSSGLPAAPSRTLASPIAQSFTFFGTGTFGAGDVNGDGVSDLVVGAIGPDRAYLYLGGAGGVPATPSLELHDPLAVDTSFGDAGSALGDVDGDGYPDFAIGAPDEPGLDPQSGAVFVYRGAPAPASQPPQVIRNSIHPQRIFFGGAIRGGFDVDGDGFADAVISPLTGLVGTPYPNAVYVYRGSQDGLIDPPAETVNSPRTTDDSFADSFALGDIDGDAQTDLITGDTLATGAAVEAGLVDVFLGHAGRLGPSPSVTLANPQGQRSGRFGQTVVVCDFDADGFDERAIAATGNDHPSSQQGVVYVLAGGPHPGTIPIAELTSPTNVPNDIFGLAMSCGR